MKNRVCALLAVFLLFSLAGCQPPKEAVPSPIPSPTAQTGPGEPFANVFTVTLPLTTESHQAEDGTVLFEYTYQHIQLNIADQPVADKITVDFLNRIDQTRKDANLLFAQANRDYTGSPSWTPYLMQVMYSPMRIDSGIISLFGINTLFSGGVRPDRIVTAANYNMITGEVLTLGSILSHIDQKSKLCDLIISELNSSDYMYSLYEGYEDTIRNRFNQDESKDEDFYFTPSGLCFYFAPYEIAPYASGIISVEIPYLKLVGILDDPFFPDEYRTTIGVLKAELANDENQAQFSHISDATLSHQGIKILLHADAPVGNVQVHSGSWTEDGLYFMPECTVVASTGVSNTQAIVLQADIPDTLPNLIVSYDVAGKSVSFYLTQSSEDSSILLLPVE